MNGYAQEQKKVMKYEVVRTTNRNLHSQTRTERNEEFKQEIKQKEQMQYHISYCMLLFYDGQKQYTLKRKWEEDSKIFWRFIQTGMKLSHFFRMYVYEIRSCKPHLMHLTKLLLLPEQYFLLFAYHGYVLWLFGISCNAHFVPKTRCGAVRDSTTNTYSFLLIHGYHLLSYIFFF